VTDKFCIIPWKHLTVGTEGAYKLCCTATRLMRDGGAPMSAYHHSLEQAWNSDYMRNVRRAMLAGENVPDCQGCYNNEATSGTSYRTTVGASLMDRPIEEVRAEAEANDYRVAVEPSFLKLELGNLCNLECRMCTSLTSSQIERDEVHSRWAPMGFFDNVPLASWDKDTAVIGPGPRVGVARSGFSMKKTSNGQSYFWTGSKASIELGLDANTVLNLLQVKFNDVGQGGQTVRIAVNGKVLVEQQATPESRLVSLDLTNEPIERKLHIEISVPDAASDAGSSDGVAVEDICIFRRPTNVAELPNRILFSRLPGRVAWENEDAFIFGEVLRNAANINRIYITGGEPFLMEKVAEIIDYLIESRNTHITLEFSTNCTKLNTQILRKLSMFKAVRLDLSVDGIEEVHEYIRFPIKWHVLDRNIRMMKDLPNAIFCVTPVIQIYNALNLTNLCRYADEMGMGFALSNMVQYPDQLRLSLMPASALALAAERLRKYADNDCKPWNREQILSLAEYMESLPGKPTPEMFRKFMLFTNDLDISRGQKFTAVHSELYEAYREAGYSWTEETLHARPKPTPRKLQLGVSLIPKEEQASPERV
jgi:MoaA/NifB/PqqE/SkfB family radical SAM enzyme